MHRPDDVYFLIISRHNNTYQGSPSEKKFFIFPGRFFFLDVSKSSHEEHSSDRKHYSDKKEGEEHILKTKYNVGYYVICIGEVTISPLKQGWIKLATLHIHQT